MERLTNVAISTVAGSGRVFIYSGDRRRVCPVQCRCVVPQTHPRGYVEQCLVSALRFCGHQLYEELGIRRLCRLRLLAWSLPFDDAAPPANSRRRRGPGLNALNLLVKRTKRAGTSSVSTGDLPPRRLPEGFREYSAAGLRDRLVSSSGLRAWA